MLKRVEFSEIAGKTVRCGLGHLGNYDDHRIAIVFDDDTYVSIEIDYGYEGDCGLDYADIDMDTFCREEMIAAGFYTQEDYDKRDAEMTEKERREAELRMERELYTLGYLRRKYPNA